MENQKLNLDANKAKFYSNMKNSCRLDCINYLNVLSFEDFCDVVKGICNDVDVEVVFKNLI